MNTKTYTVDEAKVLLKAKLPDFLRENGVEQGRKDFFRSIYNDTIDRNPSMHIFKKYDGSLAYFDFSTGRFGDIFTANHILNNAPIIGSEFITDNLIPLAEKYGIKVTHQAMTNEENYLLKIKGLYRIISEMATGNLFISILKDTTDTEVKKYLEEKNLNKHDVRAFSLGWIPSWEDFKNELLTYGATEELLEDIGIKKYIFNSNNLIFSILDHKFRVRGFIARNCYFSKENHVGAKYYNIENNVWFSKGHMLYNLNKAYERKKEGYLGPLYIVEGPTDAIAMHKAGFKSVAIGSVAFTENHINLLRRANEDNVVFLLDGDEAGRKATKDIIFKTLEGIKSFRVKVVDLPDGEDPASFISKYGADALLELPHKSAFTYRLDELKNSSHLEGHELAKAIIPLIVNDPSEIEKDAMAEELARVTNIPLGVIRKEVNRLSADYVERVKTEREGIIKNIISTLRQSPEDAALVLENGHREIMELENSANENQLGIDFQIREINDIEESGENNGDIFSIKISRMPRTEATLDGNLVGTLSILGGQPNAGKSTLLYNFINGILEYGHTQMLGWDNVGLDPNNVSIILHTVDDSAEQVVPKLATIIANNYVDRITIAEVNNINKIKYNKEEKLRARKLGYDKIKEWIKEGRLLIKDSSAGSRLVDGLRFVREYRTRYPDRLIIYIVDNMYNLTDYSEISDEKVRISRIANAAKVNMAMGEKIAVIATVEYRKSYIMGDALSNQTLNELIKETKTLEYRANWIGHLINDLHNNPDETKLFFFDHSIPMSWRKNDNRSPVILLRISKNKINPRKSTIPFLFYHERAIQVEVSKEHLCHLNNELVSKIRKYIIRDDEEIEFKEEEFDFLRNLPMSQIKRDLI